MMTQDESSIFENGAFRVNSDSGMYNHEASELSDRANLDHDYAKTCPVLKGSNGSDSNSIRQGPSVKQIVKCIESSRVSDLACNLTPNSVHQWKNVCDAGEGATPLLSGHAKRTTGQDLQESWHSCSSFGTHLSGRGMSDDGKESDPDRLISHHLRMTADEGNMSGSVCPVGRFQALVSKNDKKNVKVQ